MVKELMHAAILCDGDPAVRAVVLTGSGKMFSPGGDLKEFSQFGDRLAATLKEMTIYYHATISRFMRMDAPLITAVNGVAAGGGMSFAICGDVVLAAESASFTAAYTAAGLSPDGGMTYLLPRMVGFLRAKELILLNRRLTAKDALEWGLVNKVVPDEELMSEAEKLARIIATGPTCAFGSIKKLLNECFSETLETQMEREARSIADMSKTSDAKEGIAAFLERQQPTFGGS